MNDCQGVNTAGIEYVAATEDSTVIFICCVHTNCSDIKQSVNVIVLSPQLYVPD